MDEDLIAENEDGEFVCKQCGRAFDSEDELQEHLRSVGLID